MDSPRLKTIFTEALLRQAGTERGDYLDESCRGDEELRARVEALLRDHERIGRFLGTATGSTSVSVEAAGPGSGDSQPGDLSQAEASGTCATAPLGPSPEGPGTVIGPYKLLQPIGEGGMGTVYMAEQTQPVRRTVALKLIKAGMDSRQVLARFGAERQALALMDHPNIAKVLDAGTSDSGRPYFVMELVKGIPITRFCDERRLTLRERLELFVPVCQAVQHAHQKGIIHRDLKPSNVLIALYDGKPVPKVIDFGVAKATGPRLTDQTLYTEFGAVVGTLEYMSPEQAELNQLDIDTRSDIYSLGVLLYELLTGSTPLDRKRLKQVAILEMLRVIREVESPRPSLRLSTTEELPSIAACRHVEPRKLSGLVRGELDWIVMKALEKDRTRRYETANGLAADVRRYLDHEPVVAGPPSSWYRLRKFARRNRAALAAAALIVTALLVGTGVSTWQAIRARAAEELAQKRLEAESTARLQVTQERNRTDLARQEADRRATEAREVVDFLINDLIGAASPTQAQGKLPTVDEVLAQADQKIAQRFDGQPLIEASIQHALGQAYMELGVYPKAEKHEARAVELRLVHLGPEHAETINAQNTLGMTLIRQRGAKYEEARTLLIPVLETARKSLGPEHPETLQTMQFLASALVSLDKNEEARTVLEELLAIRRRVMGPNHPQSLKTMRSLAIAWNNIGNPEKAKQLYEQVLAIQLRDRPDHPDTLATMISLAILLVELGRFDQAIEMTARALDGGLRILGVAHPWTQSLLLRFCRLARGRRENLDRVRGLLEKGLDRSRHQSGSRSRVTTAWADSLAFSLVTFGRADEAVVLIEGLPANREDLDVAGLAIRTRLALALREHGRLVNARLLLEETLAEALRLREKDPNPDSALEEVRGIAQFLLGRWPGFTPGISPREHPTAPFAIEAPFRASSPVADGRITPGEYGTGIEVSFEGDSNPGRMWRWGKSRTKTPDDLSAQIHTAYTDRSLFLAFRVRDQFVDTGERGSSNPVLNDGVEVFINGDQVANDMPPLLSKDVEGTGNREGFQLVADAGGHMFTSTEAFANSDWKLGTSRTPDGYVIEFEIPLTLIDTKDGPETVAATGGSEVLVNFAITDVDSPVQEQTDYGIVWAEDPAISPYMGGEDFWTVSLRLVPKPTSSPGPSGHP